MKLLIYGSGVLGSHLAHILIQSGNDVTMLARGKRYEELEKDGVVLRHYFQRKDTTDKVKVIRTLEKEDCYDLIFVVMQYGQFRSVLPTLANNESKNIVLIGNNAEAERMQDFIIQNSTTEKMWGLDF